MVAKSFEVGDLVWAKMKGFPPWPGKIVVPPSGTKVKKSQHYVFFYGSDNHAWITDENIALHNERLVEKYTRDQKRPPVYLTAVEIIVNASKGSSKYQKNSENSFDLLSSNEGATPKSKSPHSNNVTKKGEIKKVPVKKLPFVKKDSRKRAANFDRNSTGSSSFDASPSKLSRCDEDFSDLLANIPPNYSYSNEPGITDDIEDDDDIHPFCRTSINSYVDRPPTPSLDLHTENEALKKKDIIPSSKKFGFLGLGKLGQGIVKNLIQSGHSITVWNRSPEKCEEFKKIGAQQLETPADVVSFCDITFCCVTDAEASKALVFGNWGVLKGLEASNVGNKGFVDLTSLDPKTSHAIGEEITVKGGRYLEAPLTGSRVEAIEGTLFILGAGDKTLFDDCKTCFCAMGKNALYISGEVGAASKFNIIHNVLLGTVYAAVAESLALVERVGLDQNDFLEILQFGVLNSSVVIEKGRSMINSEYTSNTPLRHMQKDLNLALILGDSAKQPLPLTSATNEVFKHCKLLRYSDHDVSAIYEGTKR